MTRRFPTEPGIYVILEPAEEPFLAYICRLPDASGDPTAILPDDDYRYPLDLWSGAFFIGPFPSMIN